MRHVANDHTLFVFFEAMWEIAKVIRIRMYGDLDVQDGLPVYSPGATFVRLMVLNAHKFAPIVSEVLLFIFSISISYRISHSKR